MIKRKTFFSQIQFSAVVVFSFVLFSSCKKDDPVMAVTTVTLNKNVTTIEVGKTEALIAAITPENTGNAVVFWSSNKEAVATVDANGLVSAVAIGMATITATTADGGKSAGCEVSVEPRYLEYGTIMCTEGYYFNFLPFDERTFKLYLAEGTTNSYKIENLYGGGQDLKFVIQNEDVIISEPKQSFFNGDVNVKDYPLHRIPTAMNHLSFGMMTAWIDSDPKNVYCTYLDSGDKLALYSEMLIRTYFTAFSGFLGWTEDDYPNVLMVTDIK